MGTARDERAHVRGAQRGSVPDLEALFRTHWSRAFRAAYLVTHDAAAAEDIAQEAFLAAVRSLHRFDRQRPFGPWLHRIAVNRAIDWARARKLRGEIAMPAAGEAADPARSGDPPADPPPASPAAPSPREWVGRSTTSGPRSRARSHEAGTRARARARSGAGARRGRGR